jgi:parvulin-like peptidyl-prolyl isomerase
MPSRTRAQRRRNIRDRQRNARQPVQASVRWRDVPAALRDWTDLPRAQRVSAASRTLTILAIVTLSLISPLVGGAIHREIVVKPNQAVARVNDVNITATDYARFLAFRRYELQQLESVASTSTDRPRSSNPRNPLSTLFFDAIADLINAELVRANASKLGIAVDKATVDAVLLEFAMGPTESRTNTPTGIAVQKLSDTLDLDRKSIRTFIQQGLLAEAAANKLAERLNPTPEQILVSQIVTTTEDEAETVIARLNARQPFELIAQEVSSDESSHVGGTLGWMPRGLMPAAWENAAFNLRKGARSLPVSTEQGWHIIEVHERAQARELDASVLARLRNAKFDEWIGELRLAANPEVLLTAETIAWAQDQLPPQT